MFVLMGNFQSFACSSASTDYAAIKANFGALAALLASFPRIVVRHGACGTYDPKSCSAWEGWVGVPQPALVGRTVIGSGTGGPKPSRCMHAILSRPHQRGVPAVQLARPCRPALCQLRGSIL